MPSVPSGKIALPPSVIEFLLDQPALKTPPGAIQHLDNHADDAYWWYICVVLSMTVAGIFVLIRFYTKIFIVRKFEAADYFIILGMLLFVGEIVLGRLCIPHGAGAHQWNVQVKHMFELLRLMNICEIMYGPWVFIVKMAVLLQYLRMFAPNRTINPFVFYGTWIITTVCALFYTADTLATIFACTPREKIWNKLYSGGHCINYHAVVISTGFFNIFSDVAILLLPVRSVWKLRIPTRKKIGISFLFATGILACVASTMRVVHTWRIVKDERTADVSYNIVAMGLWSYAEVALGIIVACTLSLPKLIQAKGWKMPFSLFSSSPRSFPSLKIYVSSSAQAEPKPKESTSTEGANMTVFTVERWDSARPVGRSSEVV